MNEKKSFKKGGYGKGNVGTYKDELKENKEEIEIEEEELVVEEPAEVVMTLDEYKKKMSGTQKVKEVKKAAKLDQKQLEKDKL